MSPQTDDEQRTADSVTIRNPDIKRLFADFGIRLAGAVLDLFIALLAVYAPLMNVIGAIGLTIADGRLIALAVFLLYLSMFWSSPLRATPAQLLLGIRVVDELGGRLSLGRAVVRSILSIGILSAALTLSLTPSMPYFGIVALAGFALFFLAAVTPNRQAGHDLIARSIVVNRTALKSPETRAQLSDHVSSGAPISGNKRRPSVLSIAGNVFVLGIPVFVFYSIAQLQYDMDLRHGTNYALQGITELKNAVEIFHTEHSRWPTKENDLGVTTKGHYPDGGYFELEDDGVVRIHFTVRPELMRGSISSRPKSADNGIVWECRVDGDIAAGLLPAACRD